MGYTLQWLHQWCVPVVACKCGGGVYGGGVGRGAVYIHVCAGGGSWAADCELLGTSIQLDFKIFLKRVVLEIA